MKLPNRARERGISYQTAWRWWKAGKLQAPAEQMPSGAIIMHPEVPPARLKATIYARVSSADQKEDLARQADRPGDYASVTGSRDLAWSAARDLAAKALEAVKETEGQARPQVGRRACPRA